MGKNVFKQSFRFTIDVLINAEYGVSQMFFGKLMSKFENKTIIN
jgi:hypothetical protein